jgi:methionine synthase II (cobalamin-independent)
MDTILPTTLVGSYPQPDWLIDRAKLAGRFPPRVRAKELWRIAPERLEQAQDDATLLAIRDQERAGLDIITDGEMRRESYSNRFATALDGVDIDNPGTALDRSGHPNPVPRVVGRIRRRRPIQVRDVTFLRADTDHRIKITVPGAFTMAQQAQNDFYKDDVELAMDYATAVNEEIKDLFAAGADVVQIDEPVPASTPGEGKAIRRTGVEPRAQRNHRNNCGAHMLRIRCDNTPETFGLFFPARTRRSRRAADFDRNCTIAPRLQGARGVVIKDYHARGLGSRGRDRGDTGDRG